LEAKRAQLELKTLTARSFWEYKQTTDLLVATFGRSRLVNDLQTGDFERLYKSLVGKYGASALGREITHARSVFKHAVESDLIDRAVGSMFKGPSKADRRKARAKKKHQRGACMFTAAEIEQILKSAGPQLKAMVLLGINCGFGNTDCATPPKTALDLERGWIDFPRPKTGIERRIPLWRETVAALKVVLAKPQRAADAAYSHFVFLTRLGQPWVRFELAETTNEASKMDVVGKADDAIAKSMAKLLKELGIYRKGVTFYALRHTFETIAGGCHDQVVVDAVIGHVDATMAAEYREDIEDERLKAVVDHVQQWLYAKPAKGTTLHGATKSQQKNAALRVVG